jgi:hypothetical protein
VASFGGAKKLSQLQLLNDSIDLFILNELISLYYYK